MTPISPNTSSSGSDKKEKKRTIGQVVDFITKWLVLIIGLPIRLAASIVSQFVGNGGTGRAVVGGALFLIGSAISTDSIWQTIFQQPPVFPYFESNWSWANVAFAILNPFFYVAFLIAVGIQVIEAYALRGKNPDAARRELEDHLDYTLDSKPSGKIDLVGELWTDYKTSGLRDHSSAGYVSLAVWAFDLVTTFAARNPLSYTAPLMVLGCFLFNLGTMLSGEIGFKVWQLTKD